MSKNMKIKINVKNSTAWSAEDRQAFADGNILKSRKVPNRRRVQNRTACRGRGWRSEI
jgi:hypothetical protein